MISGVGSGEQMCEHEQDEVKSGGIRDFDHMIFGPSDIPDTPIDELVEELAWGFPSEQRRFVEEAAAELEQRLTTQRFSHSISVARTAASLAEVYGTDRTLCVCTGLIHDWDKCYKGQDMFDRARDLGVELPEGYRNLEPLLHAITGARALELRFPGIDPRIVQAVARHTSGAIDMSDLDMVVYISDLIEPLRTFDHLKALREMVGKVSLRDLFAACFKSTIVHLVENERYLHPDSASIWNAYVAHRIIFPKS